MNKQGAIQMLRRRQVMALDEVTAARHTAKRIRWKLDAAETRKDEWLHFSQSLDIAIAALEEGDDA